MRQYLQKIEKDEELYSIFRLLFEEEYMNESIFARKVDLCESKCVESICLEIWSDSFSGLIAEFILNSKKYINTFIPLLLKFC